VNLETCVLSAAHVKKSFAVQLPATLSTCRLHDQFISKTNLNSNHIFLIFFLLSVK